MNHDALKILQERGFIESRTHQEALQQYLQQQCATCYVGFDPTADSLHIGHLVPIMALAHMQRCGHRPIALVGGGTGLVGDPSGKTEMRQILTEQTIADNAMAIKNQLAHFIDFNNNRALLLNNAEWLTRISYIPFLRDYGRHFSVNRMIKAESYRMRLEASEPLSFIEFNYMLLQAYDFLELSNRYDCNLQMGGSDQWGNIIAGIDLIHKVTQKNAFGITFKLITTASGQKMGKTAAGAVWLDDRRTSPYDYYQYWMNTADKDVLRFLLLYTFLPKNEIDQVSALAGADINAAKSILAYETTQLVHGQNHALKALEAAASVFGARAVRADILPSSNFPRQSADCKNSNSTIPYSELVSAELETGIPAFKLFHLAGLVSSSGAGRRLIKQGGCYLNGERIESQDYLVTAKDLVGTEILLRAGKKRFHKIRLKN